MARHPDWFGRLDSIIETVRRSAIPWLGRSEIQAVFGCSPRDSIRLLHKFGAKERDNALALERPVLLMHLEAIRAGSTFAAFEQQRLGVARQLMAARADTAARSFRVRPVECEEQVRRFADLPKTITWRRQTADGGGRFEIVYRDGADLMLQLADFLAVVGVNREEFLESTEAVDGSFR